MSRRDASFDYSTSMLDLCCCALGGLILLMILLVPMTRGRREMGGGSGSGVARRITLSVRLPVIGPPARPGNRTDPDIAAHRYLNLVSPQQAKAVLLLDRPAYRAEFTLLQTDHPPSAVTEQMEIPFGVLAHESRLTAKSFLLGPPPAGGPENSQLSARIDLQFPVEKDEDLWPMDLTLNLAIQTPLVRVTPGLERLWARLGEHWDELYETRPGPSYDDRPQVTVLGLRLAGQAQESVYSLTNFMEDVDGIWFEPSSPTPRPAHRIWLWSPDGVNLNFRPAANWRVQALETLLSALGSSGGRPLRLRLAFPGSNLENPTRVLAFVSDPAGTPPPWPVETRQVRLDFQLKVRIALKEAAADPDDDDGVHEMQLVVERLQLRPIVPDPARIPAEFPSF